MRKTIRDPGKVLAVFLPILIVVAAPSIRRWTLDAKAAAAQTSSANLEARNLNAFALILGEMRATAADLMFIKTERYFHSGIAYKPHMDLDKMATTGERAAKENESHDGDAHKDYDREHHESGPSSSHGHNALEEPVETEQTPGHQHGDHDSHGGTHSGGVPTLIRTAAQDFRGFLGHLERETKPYRDPKLEHHVTTGDELLPWYRLMTLTDPHNLRGYMIGTMLLMQAKKLDKGLSFIQEGIEKNQGNPQSFRLYASLAQVQWRGGRLEEALAAAIEGYEMGKAVRPQGGEIGAMCNGVVWSDDLENDFMFVARFVPLFLERKGELARALRTAREVAHLAPDDAPTQRIIERLEKTLSAPQTSEESSG